MRGFAVLVVLLVAGCSQPAAREAVEAPVIVLEGWVVDERFLPVANATIMVAAADSMTQTGEDGHYLLQAPAGVDLLVLFSHTAFVAQSRAVSAQSGQHHWINVTLERLPVAEPYLEVQSFQGVLRCGAVATTQEDPSRPHEHQGVRCSQLLNDTANQWPYEIPAQTTGIVVEAFWDAQSPVAQAMVLKVVAASSGKVFAFTEGTSPIRAHLSSFNLMEEQGAGFSTLTVTLEPGAGTGNHEHGAVGLFAQQSFTLYATAFFNGPVPPAYTIDEG